MAQWIVSCVLVIIRAPYNLKALVSEKRTEMQLYKGHSINNVIFLTM